MEADNHQFKDESEPTLLPGVFDVVEKRFIEAWKLSQETDLYKHLLFDRDPATNERLVHFLIAESYELFRKNEGESFEVIIPVEMDEEGSVPRSMLSPENSNRHFRLIRRKDAAVEELNVTDLRISNYGDIPEDRDTSPSGRLIDLLLKLATYEVVPLRKTRLAS